MIKTVQCGNRTIEVKGVNNNMRRCWWL